MQRKGGKINREKRGEKRRKKENREEVGRGI